MNILKEIRKEQEIIKERERDYFKLVYAQK